MLYRMSVTLVTQLGAASIIENICRVVKNNRGEIVQSSDEVVVVILGSKLLTRLIGVWYASEFSKFQLPTKLRIEIINGRGENRVVIDFVDNLGLGLPDQYSDTAYKKYFRTICDSIKEQLSAKELTPPNEQSGESDFAGNNSGTAVMPLQNCQVSIRDKKYPRYYLWCVIGIFWFFPFGMIATVYASQAVTSINSGNNEKAIAKERIAKRWLVATAIAGAFFVAVGIYYDVYRK